MSDFIEADGLLPGEKPEKLRTLFEMLEGQTLAWLHLSEADGSPMVMPDGGPALGLELVSGERWLVWAAGQAPAAKIDLRFRWCLLWRRIPPQKITTKRTERYFGQGRDGGLAAAMSNSGTAVRMEAEEIQRVLEGQVIAGLRVRREPSPEGGERSILEFRTGWRLALEAGPPPAFNPLRPSPLSADLAYIGIPPSSQQGGKRIVVIPKLPSGLNGR